MPLLGFMQASLSGSAGTGQTITFDVRSVKMTLRGGVFHGRAHCEGGLIAEAELAFSATEAEKAGRKRCD